MTMVVTDHLFSFCNGNAIVILRYLSTRHMIRHAIMFGPRSSRVNPLSLTPDLINQPSGIIPGLHADGP